MSAPTAEQAPYRAFEVEVRRIGRPSPSFARITFTGTDLAAFADNGSDQRFKLVLPLPDSGLVHFPRGEDWYSQWRALPDDQRNPIRTYTVLAARPENAELDVDLVLHGDVGPASRWASAAEIGDRLVLIGPNRDFPGDTSAIEWRPGGRQTVLIGADPTALPAACAILTDLPRNACGIAVLEIPTLADRRAIDGPAGVRIDWRIQDGPPGAALETGVRAAAADLLPRPVIPGSDQDLEAEFEEALWDVPPPAAEPAKDSPVYAWLAGESSAVVRLRRHLVRDLAVDRKSVAFMGYWKQGRAEST